MKPLYTEIEFLNTKPKEKLSCQCYQCNSTFFIYKSNIQQELTHNRGRIKFCSQNCNKLFNKPVNIVTCKNCNKEFHKRLCEVKKTKNNFCSMSCAGSYNNLHKTKGTIRSKLEIYLEETLLSTYNSLQIDFNKKDTIDSELDIYIPSLKLAFELNGIFHYEPIFGQEKLSQIQNNDQRKFQACLEKNIELCIIDNSGMKYFKKESADKFLNIIINIINSKLT